MGFKTCWRMIPKVMFWNIWIEHNQRIFNDKYHTPYQITIKTKAILGEIMNASLLSKNKDKLTLDESRWLVSFNISETTIAKTKKPLEVWELRMDKTHFEIWLKERKICKLFFDEASKGKIGALGGEGISKNPEGNFENEYYWNIGNDTNNMAEACGLWQGLKQLKARGIEEAIVFSDSR